jgi:hypothetical protein
MDTVRDRRRVEGSPEDVGHQWAEEPEEEGDREQRRHQEHVWSLEAQPAQQIAAASLRGSGRERVLRFGLL